MGTKFYGSICITDIFDLLNKKHSAFTKGENGKVYASVNVWLNDNVDKFGNIMSIQLNPKKDLREQDGQPYIGNLKESESKPISGGDLNKFSIPSDIPTANKAVASDISEPDDLPF
ncbi:MAG TPA: hypothetical protein PKV73_01345 [Agriterribacter sp.]|nr:hypothetical protein [Agriterribacter sp.]